MRVLGAGGTARIAARALHGAGATVELCTRRDEDGAAVARELGVAARAWDDREAATAILINTTPLGMNADDPLPLEPAAVPGLIAALDAVYTPPMTAWLEAVAGTNAQPAGVATEV